jgi:hypothetical protein
MKGAMPVSRSLVLGRRIRCHLKIQSNTGRVRILRSASFLVRNTHILLLVSAREILNLIKATISSPEVRAALGVARKAFLNRMVKTGRSREHVASLESPLCVCHVGCDVTDREVLGRAGRT